MEQENNKPKTKKIILEIDFINDKSLTAMEIAIMFKLLTNNKDFKPTINILAKQLHTSPKGIRTATDKLQAKGYLKIIKIYKKRAIWRVSQKADLNKESATE